jgi:UDPglucose 6-dehydrogenase
MKVSIVGAGFVGLTTACVIASRGIEVSIEDSNEEKLSLILRGVVPFFEPGLENLLNKVLESGKLKSNDKKFIPDLTIIAVGTPPRSDGSIDTSQVELAVKKCNQNLPAGSLVAIKSTVVPGTTREIQNKLNPSNLELLMIPEFLREGSAVNDAEKPDRSVIGSRSLEAANRALSVLGIEPETCLITTTFSAESIKYLSNAFLATCISFTNETFASVNEDDDFDATSVILGWHSDRRFKPNSSGVAGITSYLIPGPGFGGSCFPKDIRALKALMDDSGKDSAVIDAVIKTNQMTLDHTVKWILSYIPAGEKYLILGVGFKENTDDLRESPAISLAKHMISNNSNGFWHDLHVKELKGFENLKSITEVDIKDIKHFILMNNELGYREFLEELIQDGNYPPPNVYAVRYQKPISGINWLFPRYKMAQQVEFKSWEDKK